MKFCYHPEAGKSPLIITDELYTHLYKARRTKLESTLSLRNLADAQLHTYKHLRIDKKSATLELLSSTPHPVVSTKPLHLLWAITEAKNIEKTLPSLNQLGVRKLTLFYANRSQKNEKISLEKLRKILIASCEQCGRSELMNLELLPSTKDALLAYPKASVLDFGGADIYQAGALDFSGGIFIGPEGGFDEIERGLFRGQKHFGIPSEIILKSECAAVLVSALVAI